MKQKLIFVSLIALLILGFDHLTKWLVVQYIPLGSEISLIDGFFSLVHTRNQGAAFGILHGWDSPYRNLFFYGIGIIAFVLLFFYIKSTSWHEKLTLASLSLILGGACGNLSDRFLRNSVVDFLNVHYQNSFVWPAFNLADSAITVGITLLIWQTLFGSKKVKKSSG